VTEKKHVLIVGDDSATKSLVASSGTAHGRVVDFAKDPGAAISRLEHRAYDLVVTGLGHAQTDLEFLREVRRIRADARLVIYTRHQTPLQVIDALREHAFSRVAGPATPDGLAEAIERALGAHPLDEGVEVRSARSEWLAFRLHSRRRTAETVIQFMNDWDASLSPKERVDVATAFREMLLNAVEHGAQLDPAKTVDVACIRTGRLLLYQIRDPGDGFSMESLLHAAISNPVDSPAAHVLYRSEQAMRAGGFGILMTRGLVDELIYNEKGNEVVFFKYLDARAD
jgi:anti-sigma regulatory factor (Ser/Thr protein kinase)/CheY-like chemotaxis protein